MRIGNSFFYTLREDSSNDASKSGALLVKSGMIKKIGSGIYTYMPMGYRVLRKIESIIEDEMDKAGAQELLMPSLLPIDVYAKSGRVDAFGNEMFRLKDQTGRDFALGPTHEEMFAMAAKERVKRYKDLPFNLYQQADKFRDEIRSRYGLIRVREFIMKDAYTFDTLDTVDKSYGKMYKAYCNIFDRMHINYRIVRALTGAMGGDLSEEFQALSDIGEDDLVFCDKCGYSSNGEVATRKIVPSKETHKKLVKVETPNCSIIEDVCRYLKVDIKKSVKALLMDVDGELVAFFVRGDRDLNISKACMLLGAKNIEFASDELIAKSNACPGFTGPIKLNCKIVVDEEVLTMTNFVVGANEANYHMINVNVDDFKYDVSGDITNVIAGDLCPKCGKELSFGHGIEIGNLFKLGTKYSEAYDLKYLDENNEEHYVYMGSYGIGPGRVMSAVAEQNNDSHGIIWPISIAPYKVGIVITDMNDKDKVNCAYELEEKLEENGIDVLVDDREDRVGVKFNDMDLIGIPIRITIGKAFSNGEVEVKKRNSSDSKNVSLDSVIDEVKEIIKDEV